MSYSDELRYTAIARIDAGESYDDVAAELSIGKGTVIRWHKEYKTALDKGTLSELLDVDKLLLATARMQADSPTGMVEAIEQSATKVTGLAALDAELQMTATAANNRIKSMLLSVEHASELEVLVDCLCNLRKAFFEKGTQVNVQNNYEGGSRYGNYLGDKPGA